MENNNSKNNPSPLQKAAIGLLAGTVKFLLFFKQTLDWIFKIIGFFITKISRFLFLGLITKIYYLFFRFRKDGLIENSVWDIVKKKLPHFFAVLLVLVALLDNFTPQSKAVAISTKMARTTMSHLVSGEFGSLEQEDVIQEGIDFNSVQFLARERYTDEICAIKNPTNNTDDISLDDTISSDEERICDAILRPALTLSGSPTATEQPNGTSAPTKRTGIIYYTIKNGETISSIAGQFGLTVNTILWANNLGANSLIRPGDKLAILPQSGVLYTVTSGDTIGALAKKYGVSEGAIISSNTINGHLKIGQKIIIPGAKKINNQIASANTSTARNNNDNYTGVSAIKNLIKAPTKTGDNGRKMLWPTVGHRITQYYSWRHTGLDIANKVGTPLYATDGGTVEFAGWSKGYGYNVVINHGGGKKTRYAHASKLFVSVGQEVDRGENIAAMGSTGWSTGPHIHFEVIINGVKYNPLNYIK